MGGVLARTPRAFPRSPGRGGGLPLPGHRPFPQNYAWVVFIAGIAAVPAIALFAPAATSAPGGSPDVGARELAAAAHSLLLGAGPAAGAPVTCTPSVGAGFRCGSGPDPLIRSGANNSTPVWVDITPHLNLSPTARESSAIAYAPSLREVVLFGGLTDGRIALGDTWTYFNGTWTALPLANVTPAPRWGAGFVYDDEQVPGSLLLVGGRNATQFFNDTWEFGATGWRPIHSTVTPSPRAFAAIGFDEIAKEVILFGGTRMSLIPPGLVVLSDTWVFRAGVWTNISLNQLNNPPPTRNSGFAPDLGAGGLLLHGGNGLLRCSPASSTWRFYAGSWTNVSAGFGGAQPPSTFGGLWVNDTADHQLLAFGGLGSWSGVGCRVNNATWGLDAQTWTNLSSRSGNAPSPELSAAATFDGADGYVFLFGGNLSGSGVDSAQTWGYSAQPINWSGSHGSSNNSTAQLTALLQATPADGVAPLTVSFTARAAGGVPPYRYAYLFGDGSATASGGTVTSHTYTAIGSYVASVTVTDTTETSVHAVQVIAALAPWQVAHQWVDLANTTPVAPQVRTWAAMAYDPALHAVVLFGGYSPSVVPFGDTWEFTRGTWTNIGSTLAVAPPPRWGAAFAFDARAQQLVLFGGRNLTALFNDTWTFTINGWAHANPRTAPSPREMAQMAYDGTDKYVLLFGGESYRAPGASAHPLNDSWIFTGGSWANITASLGGAPPPTVAGGFAFDSHDGELVLVGGLAAPVGTGPCPASSAVWTYAHGVWAQRSSPVTPPARTGALLVDDPLDGALLMFGGTIVRDNGCSFDASTWSYANNTWTDLTPIATVPPPARCCGAIAFDALDGYALLFGGNANGIYVNDTWSYGVAPLTATAVSTPSRGGVPLNVSFAATASGGTPDYLFSWNLGDGSAATGPVANHSYRASGIFTATLTAKDSAGRTTMRSLSIDVLSAWAAGHQWIDIAGSILSAPAPRTAPAVVYDPAINAVLLFGGYSPYNFAFGDTWEFSNGVWTEVSSKLSGAPPARWGAGLTFDTRDGYPVLFGGRDVTSFFSDTWRFNGAGWVVVPSSAAPSPRAFVQMAYDDQDRYVLLFGGEFASGSAGGSTPLADTWTYTGGLWTNITTQVSGRAPGPTFAGAIAFDPFDGNVVLVGGGSSVCSPTTGAFTYTGGHWGTLGSGFGPSDRFGGGLTFDGVDQSLLAFGGRTAANGCGGSNETWLYRNASWENLTGAIGPAPSPRWDGALVFDSSDNVVLLFGGESNGVFLNDTWVYPAGPGGPISSTPGSRPLTVSAGESTTNGSAPLGVSFSVTPTGGVAPYTFRWSFGDQSPTLVGNLLVHTYTAAGSYTAAVTAIDAKGAQVTQLLPLITVSPAPLTSGRPPSPNVVIPFVPGSSTTVAFAIGFVAGNAALIWVVVSHYRRPRRPPTAPDRPTRGVT
jgi:PKD repeat protein